MNHKTAFTLFFSLLASFVSVGQTQTSAMYIGIIDVQNVGKFTYQLELKINGSQLAGYSITNSGLKNETKANISGTIKPNGSIEFMETSILKTNIKDKSTSFCFVNTSLTLKKQAGLELLEGNFKGNDAKGLFCGAGKIQLIKKIDKITDTLKTQIAASFDSVILKTRPEKINSLSNTSLNKIACIGKSIKIRVYDSGYVDGDEISVKYNENLLAAKCYLTKEGREFTLAINSQQENIIEIKTLNEGINPPNTATIDISFSNGKTDTYQLNAAANTQVRLQLISE